MPQGRTPCPVVICSMLHTLIIIITMIWPSYETLQDCLPAWKCEYINTFHLSINEPIPIVDTDQAYMNVQQSFRVLLQTSAQTTLYQPPNEWPYRNRPTNFFPVVLHNSIESHEGSQTRL